jgi:mitochondrial fission protein ELM1
MTCEACFTGKPVFSYDFKEETGRVALFHRIMQEAGYTRSTAVLTPYSLFQRKGKKLDEAARMARALTGRKL